jgi:predicted kinase
MKKLYLIRGIPGSGKSTYARSLNIPDHFEADMWFDQNEGYNPSKIKQAHSWCLNQTLEVMKQGKPVVVSNTFIRLWEMKSYQEAAKHFGYEVEEITMTGRWPNVHGVPENKIQEMLNRFEPSIKNK